MTIQHWQYNTDRGRVTIYLYIQIVHFFLHAFCQANPLIVTYENKGVSVSADHSIPHPPIQLLYNPFLIAKTYRTHNFTQCAKDNQNQPWLATFTVNIHLQVWSKLVQVSGLLLKSRHDEINTILKCTCHSLPANSSYWHTPDSPQNRAAATQSDKQQLSHKKCYHTRPEQTFATRHRWLMTFSINY
jgi:hypothetical protein